MLLSELQRVLDEHGVSSVLVACSGGVDSIVLADAAIECLGVPNVVLGHVDHAVRPDSSKDAAWVQEWGSKLGVRVLSERLPPGPSDEARLRTARYAALRVQRESAGLEYILTAHHQNDQAETVLLNLVRGTQWASLAGISEVREEILRPLLKISKQEILDYAQRRGLRWCEDLSNREPHYLRNRIRKELLPFMETRYRTGLTARLGRLASDVRQALDSGEILAVTPPSITPNKPAISAVVPNEMPSINIQKCAWSEGVLPTDAHSAIFDSSVISSVSVRRHRPGDRIRPMGMNGHKKLQDVFVDAKIPRLLRPWWMLVVDDADEVLWVPGIVRSAIAPVNSRTCEVWWCRSTGKYSCDQTTDG